MSEVERRIDKFVTQVRDRWAEFMERRQPGRWSESIAVELPGEWSPIPLDALCWRLQERLNDDLHRYNNTAVAATVERKQVNAGRWMIVTSVIFNDDDGVPDGCPDDVLVGEGAGEVFDDDDIPF